MVGVLEQANSIEMMDVDNIKEATKPTDKKYFIDTVSLNVTKKGISNIDAFTIDLKFN